MKVLGAAKFKEQCLAILDDLEPDGLMITKHGKPIAKLMPIEHLGADLIGSLKNEIAIKGELLSTGIRWEADD